ncbi:hypothetical protein [Kitasatospora sp. NPDC097643]|uniref:hypothetical protein n=1 Tax=Kitasatospora sp. NPDC097643 TaxID=3157230 RepID=UPI00332A8D77
MSVESDIPEFPGEEPVGWITCRHRPWDGVLVRAGRIPFAAGDEVAFDVTVCGDVDGRIPAAMVRGVVSVTADTTAVDYTIPWDGVLDAVVEGSITVSYSLAPAGGGGPAVSESAVVRYSRRGPGGAVCGPES